jgi:ACS family hexuronate transporter-like MFS transporter
MYDKPEKIRFVNAAELEYIEQDRHEIPAAGAPAPGYAAGKKISFLKCFTFRQTWAFVAGKFMTDGVWWFFLFWMPVYLKTQFGIKMTDGLGMTLIFTLYAIVTVLSILGGKLPTIFINKGAQNPYAARMKAMLIFAFFPLFVLLAQPLGTVSPWLPVLMISLGCAAHQAWSANLFSTIGDMIPKAAIATVTGIGGAAGGVGSMLMNKGAGKFFVYASGSTKVDGKEVEMTEKLLAEGAEYLRMPMEFFGFTGKPAGYFVIFCICALAYLVGWAIMKTLVPKYKPITDL